MTVNFRLLHLAGCHNLRDMDNAAPNPQQILDHEHLKLLSIFHYVLGGISAFFACIPIVHIVLGLFFIASPQSFGQSGNQPPAFLGWLFLTMGGCFMCFGWVFAILVLIAGRCIALRKSHTYCFVVACLECTWMPFGTCLGVFTILVLNRASVKALFNPKPSANDRARDVK
jgi:hypothetical protein